MEIAALVLIGLVAVVLIVFSALMFYENEDIFLGFAFTILSVFCLVFFSFISRDVLRDGSPKLDIQAGEYKVAFVYQAGDNVSVGVESVFDKKELLNLYQFKKEAFNGQVRTDAKKLIVLESGDFKQLKLE